jgi:hypothetical protein
MKALSQALHVLHLHSQLQTLAAASLSRLGLNGQRRTLNDPSDSLTVAGLDAIHVSLLQAVSNSFLVDNTNVTYPMKAILLLTGFSPAFDSQVGAAKHCSRSASRYRCPAPRNVVRQVSSPLLCFSV